MSSIEQDNNVSTGICVFDCERDYSESCGWIFVKFCEEVDLLGARFRVGGSRNVFTARVSFVAIHQVAQHLFRDLNSCQ